MPAPQVLRQTRMTAQQRPVLDLLGRSDRFRSAQQLHRDLGQRHSVRIRLVTVYRILHAFADMKICETQRAEDGETLYRLGATPKHRHYLRCWRCARDRLHRRRN
jgi:Fur family transcriptional regulator, ferric uptake regulator